MNTNCLYDFIGIRGCGEATPESGLYINSLPGLPLESIDKFASADQVTYKNVWRDVQERALPKFMNAVNSLLREKYKLKTLRNTIDLLRRKNSDSITVAGVNYRGFVIELNFNNSSYIVSSNYQAIAIQSISIYLQAVTTNPLPIKIFELDGEDIIYETTILVADQAVGWNTINLNKYFRSNRIFIAYDATEINSVAMEIPGYAYNNFCGCVRDIYSTGCNPVLNGASAADQNDPYTYVTGNNTFGLTAVFSIQCVYDFLVCNNKQLFASALQYYLGAELMIERQYSPRINRWTTIDIDKAKENESRFLTEAEEQLELILDGIEINLSDCCIECNQRITIQESIM